MALKVELKPGERIIIGECVITNSDQRTRFLIEGDGADPARKGHHDGASGPTRRPSASISPCSSCTRRATRARITRSISRWSATFDSGAERAGLTSSASIIKS